MNVRERFREVMNFNPSVRSLKWEFGYWGETINNWYAQGLPRQHYPEVETRITTPTSTLYSYAWSNKGKGVSRLHNGLPVMAGGLYWPTQGFPLDFDVKAHFQMDYTQVMVDVNLLWDPMFEPVMVEEDAEQLTYVDIDGVKRTFLKETATIPTSVEWPITDRASWEKLKAERLNLKNISSRFPQNWPELVKQYKNRDYPLAVGGYPHGFFGTLSHLIGYEYLFYWYGTEPDLVHDILKTFTDLWIAVYEEVLHQVEVDHWQIWEDISYGKGPMISLPMVREFMCPYIKRVGDFLRAHGVQIILLDTDGDCNSLIQPFLEAGVTGMYPFETHCGMDIVKVRKQYPRLQMLGGISKSEIQRGKERIDQLLQPVAEVLKTGGYIPFGDHFIPPDVNFENFSYYRTQLNRIIEAAGNL
ncbi:MAG TPA: uroporphyrinogen decarboxylase family protein [Verrucomicrobiota bacterium]|jgi:uroporphyrinogen decarboxylase|nr:uroporphyrinogen decarboxylase family protein [Verrucomicrobiota bacterium]HNZ76507.1 uroporphyrinogen decarboxylase family protein [Verrucomicrobiota bacterium]HOH40883.1 uroporphyrinogen decarboxylase family protein [Verrucomicrobiota bacterium]HOX63430.1 uroporphyrinogen decarboxylase family protein [Verrucomicrobiota bacterium]HPI65779.1 uroporphyrinogen decarboxylase family protein [Verrucomicrobiota bacterium]